MCDFKTDPQDLCSLLQTWAIHVKFNFKNTIFEKSRPILTAMPVALVLPTALRSQQ